MARVRMIYRRRNLGVAFVWYGGAIVDLYWTDSLLLAGAFGQPARPITAYSLFDGVAGGIPEDRQEFTATCERWIEHMNLCGLEFIPDDPVTVEESASLTLS